MGRVLVTGATGCLGNALAHQLLQSGCVVTAQGRNLSDALDLVRAGADFLPLDFRAPEASARQLLPHLWRVETVYHCAALSSAWGPAGLFQAVNVTATANLLDAAREAGVRRFVFASSPSIYADGTDRLDLREDAALPARFATAYARSKYEAERLVLAADQPGGMRTVALRPRAIYGRGDRALMPRLMAAIGRGSVPLIGGGASLIDLTHVSDAARAMRLAADHAEQAGGRAFNITSGRSYPFRELLGAACDLTKTTPRLRPVPYGAALALAATLEAMHRLFRPKVEPVLTRQAVASLGRSLTLDISAARDVLSYRPQVSLDEGIKDYA
ncbi:NAD-dependent epimerase/dehydratase family protein [Paracoccus aminophilus]|uniref:3-beta-hydroxysteroid dehydrogenase/isomerase n=1 Tax=Paracoccus aminophilus JCM 7686 TaxID=1367847 RepID=S5YSR2_PARAH|nr:NAD(P)-dependent oxidoreductase [Paracoccus aminophilus]AGT08276.1 3-beta-hydroxysteroid dehydrogenase/isomerase [Paracoccus aminophilus JCM 7686]